MSNDQFDDAVYLRAAIVTSEHPERPLDGTTIAISKSNDVCISELLLEESVQQARARFDIDSYANDLKLGTLYFQNSNHEFVGVSWEESPRPYTPGGLDELVDTLPDGLVPLKR